MYTFKFESDKIKFNKFKLDLDLVMEHKSKHCAPVHEAHWDDELIRQIRLRCTPKEIARIAKELTGGNQNDRL